MAGELVSGAKQQIAQAVPIDRGWAWCVCAGGFIINLIISGFSRASGILLEEVSEKFAANKMETSGLLSAVILSAIFVSPTANALCQSHSSRPVIFAGGLMIGLGCTISSFINSLIPFIFVFGIATGSGMGFCMTPALATVSQYFKERRSLAMGITMSGGGFGAFVMPSLIYFLIETFMFEGMLLILGGITTHICVAAALLRPQSFYLGPKANALQTNRAAPEGVLKKIRTARLTRLWKHIRTKPLYKNPSLYLCGIPLALATDGSAFCYMILPGLCIEVGLSKDDTTLFLLIMGFPDIFGRLAIGWMADKRWMRSAHYVEILLAVQIVILVAVSLTPSYWTILAFCLVMGLVGGSVMTLLTPVMIDAVGIAYINSALGLFMIFKVLFFGVPILLGAVRDSTTTWTWSFRTIAVLLLAVELLILTDNIAMKRKDEKAADKSRRKDRDSENKSHRLEPLIENEEAV